MYEKNEMKDEITAHLESPEEKVFAINGKE